MLLFYTAIPAYGRDYRNAREVMQDWDAGKDFQLQGQSGYGYINKQDAMERMAGATINIRYSGMKKILPLKV